MTRSFDQAQQDANRTYNTVLADCIERGMSEEDANVLASRAYTSAMQSWESNEAYPDQSEVIDARKASTDQQYVSLTDLMRDYEAREDMRHLMSGKTA